jgi:Predicted periplasmic lipoprotein (DUF2279)
MTASRRWLRLLLASFCLAAAAACQPLRAQEGVAPEAGPAPAEAEPLDLLDPLTDASLYAIDPRGDVYQPYGFDDFRSHAASVKWELAAIAVIKGALGVTDWGWGSDSFHVTSEGFFGEDTDSGGMDKLGHAYSAYIVAEFLTGRIRQSAADPARAPTSAAIMSMGFMTYVEIFDAFADDHGFSWEDMAANASGVAFSVLRNTVPGLEEKVDFRIEWEPRSWEALRHPVLDYMGQKYLLALKPAGFGGLRETPLRFTELHLGYYARNYEDETWDKRERNLYVGIGLNLREIYDAATHNDNSFASRTVRTGLEYVQVPYTYVPLERELR